MKHVIQLAGILLLLAAGCRSTDSIEQLQPGHGKPGCNAVTILAPLSNDLTRTTLDQVGDTYSIYWKIDDEIGVFSFLTDNAQFILNSIGDQGEVAFQGTITGDPAYAYYPYSGEAGDDPESISMNLPATQQQTGNDNPNMAYDLKAGQRNGGSAASGYTFTFQQKLTLLRFTLTPDASLDGDQLLSIKLTAPEGSKLAGDYTLDITSSGNDPVFLEQNSSNEVTVSFVGSTVSLEEDTPVVGYVFINPDIAQDDQLVITVNTDKHVVTTLSATAGENFVRGAIYEIGLNIAALATADKIDVSPKNSWATTVSAPGYYTISGAVATVVHQYEPFKDQYAWSTTVDSCSFRIQSMKKGMLTKMTVPENDAEVNDNVNLTLYTIYGNNGIVGTVYNNCLLVRKHRVSDSMVAWWLESSDGNNGFVIWKEDVEE